MRIPDQSIIEKRWIMRRLPEEAREGGSLVQDTRGASLAC